MLPRIGLVLLGAACSTGAVALAGWAAASGKIDGEVTYGAYWSTQEGFRTRLLVQNPQASPHRLQISLFTHEGKLLSVQSLELGPNGSSDLEFSRLVEEGQHGHAFISFPRRIQALPAQLLISKGSGAWVVDFEDQRNLGFASGNRHALVPALEIDEVTEAHVILTNVGVRRLSGSAILDADSTIHRRHWDLGPRQTKAIRLDPTLLQHSTLAALSVETLAPSNDLLLTGFVTLRNGLLLPLHFQGGVRKPSGELVGFYWGEQSALALWNRSGQERSLRITLRDGSAQTRSHSIDLASGERASIDLRDLADLAPDSEGVVIVRFEEGVPILGQVLVRGGFRTSVALKDSLHETNEAYALSTRLGPALSTKVRVYNPNQQQAEVCLFLHHRDGSFTFPIKRLGPKEFAVIDWREAQMEALRGEVGGLVPENLTAGQTKLVLHSPDAERNLVAMGAFEDSLSGETVSFQGCFSCPPTIDGLGIDPSSFNEFAGGERRFRVLATFNDNGIKKIENATAESFRHTLHPGIADVEGDKLRFHSAGSTGLLVSLLRQCFEVAGAGEPGSRLQCRCIDFVDRHESATIRVRPRVDRLSLAQGAAGADVRVTITGRGFGLNPTVGVSGGGITARIESSSQTSISATLSITQSALGGSRSLTVSSAGETSAPLAFFVQVPASLRVLSVGVAQGHPNPTAAGCPSAQVGSLGPFGVAVRVQYQVMDQQNPPQPIRSSLAIREDLFEARVDGQEVGNDRNDVPANDSGRTDSQGRFIDDPVGGCASGPFNVGTFRQRIFVPTENERIVLRLNNFTLSGFRSGCGSLTNAVDITFEKSCD